MPRSRAADASSPRGGGGDGLREEATFARRVQQFDGVTANSIEREYLLGGGVAPSALARGRGMDAYDPVVDHKAMTPSWVRKVSGTSSLLGALLSAALLAACVYEWTDAGNADEKCPLLMVGAVIAGVAVVVAVTGLAAARRRDDQSGRTTETLFFLHHWGALLSVVLLVGLAIFTLMHWDISGEPIHDLFHRPETVGVRYRFLIWGLALAAALVFVVSMFGTLGRDWYDEDALFRRTFVAGCALQMAVGVAVFSLGLVMWGHGEVRHDSNPVYLFGSLVAGAALFAVNAVYVGASSVRRLTRYLVWLPLVAVPVMAFSVGNAVSAEPQSSGPPRHHNQLLSGLVGVWGQVFTVVSIVAGSRWRFYLYSTNMLPEYGK